MLSFLTSILCMVCSQWGGEEEHSVLLLEWEWASLLLSRHHSRYSCEQPWGILQTDCISKDDLVVLFQSSWNNFSLAAAAFPPSGEHSNQKWSSYDVPEDLPRKSPGSMHIPSLTGTAWLLDLLLVQHKSLAWELDWVPLLYRERCSAVHINSCLVPFATISSFMQCRHEA